ncbi:MAG: type II toxin-antitoxin system RelE/ParE family toxin [Chloroflexota bacterium]|nr:MAG: type II toxin-antitoxin system RelE/ParE family toxin [Chloroflexota bacterium]
MNWRIRLGGEAERDFVAIIRWTIERFGKRPARVYRDTLTAAIAALGHGQDLPGSALRNEIAPGLRSVHVAGSGRRGRHFIVYRPIDLNIIEVVRILHDSTDPGRHLSQDDREAK